MEFKNCPECGRPLVFKLMTVQAFVMAGGTKLWIKMPIGVCPVCFDMDGHVAVTMRELRHMADEMVMVGKEGLPGILKVRHLEREPPAVTTAKVPRRSWLSWLWPSASK